MNKTVEALGDVKKEIRKQILTIRDHVPKEEREKKSKEILQRVYELECYQNATHVLAFASFGSEINTIPFCSESIELGKSVFYPKIINDSMDFFPVQSVEDLSPGFKGILEPRDTLQGFSDLIQFEQLEKDKVFVLVPGVAFDRKRNRLGYGRGFYDAFFRKLGFLNNAAIGFSFQIVEEIPVNDYDVKPELIISENDIII